MGRTIFDFSTPFPIKTRMKINSGSFFTAIGLNFSRRKRKKDEF